MRTFLKSAGSAGKRFFQFAASIALLAISSLWFVRAAIQTEGLSQWSSVAIGQTIGAIAAVLVGYGWSIAGPVRIAGASSDVARHREFADAFTVRIGLLIVATIACGVIFLFLPDIDVGLATLGAIPVMTIALSGSFYYIGMATPGKLFFVETMPRVAFTVVAGFLMTLGAIGLSGGLFLQIAGNAAAVAISLVYVLKRSALRRATWNLRPRYIRSLLIRQRNGLASSMLVTAISNSPIIIVSLVAGGALGAFSVVDKLSKQVLAGSSPVTAVLQGWVPKAGPHEVERRSRIALFLAWCAAAFAAGAMTAVSPPLIHWVGAGQIQPDIGTFLLMGGFVGLFLAQNAISFACLAAQDQLRVANISLAVCAPAGLILVAALAPAWGTNGALAGVCLGMGFACIWQTIAVLRWRQQ